MRTQRFLDCLGADYARLRDLAGKDLDAPVPTCPGWTVRDLVRHVAQVYLHKAESIRRREFPEPWPPPELAGEEPLSLLDRAWAALSAQFAAHAPEDSAYTWNDSDQSVGFWIRRMAQETLVHRLDAELALGVEVAPVPADLALDGIDEVLCLFVDYGSKRWADEFAGVLPTSPAATVHVVSGGRTWAVTTGAGVVDVVEVIAGAAGPSSRRAGAPVASIVGEPAELLRWLWSRGGAGVVVDGDAVVVAALRRLLTAATQ